MPGELDGGERQSDYALSFAARDLAGLLTETYRKKFVDCLQEQDYPNPISRGMVGRLEERGWDVPRIQIISGAEANRRYLADMIARTEDDEYPIDPEKLVAPDDSVVVNFRLPVPLEKRWSLHQKTEYEGEQYQVPISWGDRYYYLIDAPWKIISDWQDRHPGLVCDRLNPPSIHKNGDDGYYYLLCIQHRSAKSCQT